MDAIHLGTAQEMGVAAFHTYDAKLPRFAEALGFPVGPPARPE